MIDYRGFTVEPKRDFGPGPGFYLEGRYTKIGYVVVRGFCNVMPGAAWFRTIEDAKEAIDIWIDVKEDAALFWVHIRAKKEHAA